MVKHLPISQRFFGRYAVALILLVVLVILPPSASESRAQSAPPADLLTATYIAPDGSFAIAYPTGGDWQVSGSNHSVTFLNQPIYGTLVPGQVRITVSITGTEYSDLLTTAQAQLSRGYVIRPPQPDDPVSLTIGERDALSYTMSDGGFADASYLLVIDLGEGQVAVVSVFAMGGELSGFVALAHAMAATLSVWPPLEIADGVALEMDQRVLTETYTSEDSAITFRYPSGWVVEAGPDLLVVASTEEYNVPVSEAGEITAFIYTLSTTASTDPVELLAGEIRAMDEPTGSVIAFTLDGKPAARAIYADDSVALYDLARIMDGDFGLRVVACVAPDSITQLEPLLLAIASTVMPSSTTEAP